MARHEQLSQPFNSYINYIDSRIDSISHPSAENEPAAIVPPDHRGGQCPTLQQLTPAKPRFEDLDRRLCVLDTQTRCVVAVLRNRSLRNLNMPIEPLPRYRSESKQINPKLDLYPRNATELYALRSSESRHQKEVLAYLIELYDIPYHTWSSPASGSCWDHDCANDSVANLETHASQSTMTMDDAIRNHAARIVQHLKEIIGLSESQFNVLPKS